MASNYDVSLGRSFPISGVISALNASGTSMYKRPFISTNMWKNHDLSEFVPEPWNNDDAPAIIRMMVSPITTTSEGVDNTLLKGDLLGAMIGLDLINDERSLLELPMTLFGNGYFGVFSWNQPKRSFQIVSSVFKENEADPEVTGVGLGPGTTDVLARGISSSFTPSQIYIEEDVAIGTGSYTVAIVPLIAPGEFALTDYILHTYIVRGIDQGPWNALLLSQHRGQGVINLIQLVTFVVGMLLTYLPMYRFLASLERAFTIASVSRVDRARIEKKRTETFLGMQDSG